jgi:hypothetical protein
VDYVLIAVVNVKMNMNVRKIMPEPREDDNIALDKNTECDECGCFMCDCVCNEPDVMHADMYED